MKTNETSKHRALADPRRGRIVDELRSAAEGLGVAELASRLELHQNTVRWHLGILADAGIVASHTESRSTPGRPRVVWQLAAPEDDVRQDYRLLASILTGTIAGTADGSERAEDAGREWGRFLVERPPPFTRTTDGEAVASVVRLLDEQGFRAEEGDGEILMRRCPFHELAEAHGQVVCRVHRGLISGALAELGSKLEVESLEPFVRPDLCVARLAARAAESRPAS